MSIPDFTKRLTIQDNKVYNVYNNGDKFSFPNETKRDTVPFSGQLPYSTTSKQYNFKGYRQKISESTNLKGQSVCFNTRLAQVPFYMHHWQPFENMPFVPFNGDVLKDPRYSQTTNNFSNKYKNTV
jgi:hypothetical protein